MTDFPPRIEPMEPPYPEATAETLRRMMPRDIEPLKLFRTIAWASLTGSLVSARSGSEASATRPDCLFRARSGGSGAVGLVAVGGAHEPRTARITGVWTVLRCDGPSFWPFRKALIRSPPVDRSNATCAIRAKNPSRSMLLGESC